MNSKLRILNLSSEMAPFVKTGGLADVNGTLPHILAGRGHEVACVIPKYSDLKLSGYKLERAIPCLSVWMGTREEWCAVDKIMVGDVSVYLIEFDAYFSRRGIYHDDSFNDFSDNPGRYAFFCRAALETARALGFRPDVVHCHDWQTAIAAAYLKLWHGNDPFFSRTSSVLTIHNASYQGIYPGHWRAYLGLPDWAFTSDAFECYGGINFLKGGIHFADAVNTVSPNYAREISSPGSPSGLAMYLSDKRPPFCGILNGVDYQTWNPETDTLIPARYSRVDLSGKATCKAALQKSFGLSQDPGILLMGIVGRFTEQKGYALIRGCIERVLQDMHVQFAVLGSGDPELEGYFRELPRRYPGRAGSWVGYREELSHLIESGADLFLMPSLFEPCGLNQMYSLRYGTLPLVRETGGLADTVEQYEEKTGAGTGFRFSDPRPEALYYTIGWAVSTWYDRKAHWKAMQERGMEKRYSWDQSAEGYEELYEMALSSRRGS